MKLAVEMDGNGNMPRPLERRHGDGEGEDPMETCKKCNQVLDPQARLCACGAPTVRATFKERSEYEVRQWRAYKSRTQESA